MGIILSCVCIEGGGSICISWGVFGMRFLGFFWDCRFGLWGGVCFHMGGAV